MHAFKKIFSRKCSVIGMIHVNPLPGTPRYESGTFNRLIEKAKHETEIYMDSKVVSTYR